jgi:hypothetical protein
LENPVFENIPPVPKKPAPTRPLGGVNKNYIPSDSIIKLREPSPVPFKSPGVLIKPAYEKPFGLILVANENILKKYVH